MEFIKMITKDKKKWENIAIAFLLGVFLLVVIIPGGKKKAGEKSYVNQNDAYRDADYVNQNTANRDVDYVNQSEAAYKKDLEEQLTNLLSNVKGVGKVCVMITLKSSKESIVEKDIQSEGEKRVPNTVMIEAGGEKVPFVVKENMPSVDGVVIIAEGGDDPRIVSLITDASMALFSIDAHKVKVLKMKIS